MRSATALNAARMRWFKPGSSARKMMRASRHPRWVTVGSGRTFHRVEAVGIHFGQSIEAPPVVAQTYCGYYVEPLVETPASTNGTRRPGKFYSRAPKMRRCKRCCGPGPC